MVRQLNNWQPDVSICFIKPNANTRDGSLEHEDCGVGSQAVDHDSHTIWTRAQPQF